jgi:hypothetical protein
MLNLTLGTPPQRIQVNLDTGSSGFSVIAATASFCEANNPRCPQLGTYNANKSSTYKFVDDNLDISYPYKGSARGDFATDIMMVAGISVPNVQFGITYNDFNLNVLGLGYGSDESTDLYANFPEILANNGMINSVAYSMWTDNTEGTGTILFGGVNTAQYTGDLHTLPMLTVNGEFRQPAVLVTGMALQANSSLSSTYNSSALPEHMILDSGLHYTYLPNPIALWIYTTLGGYFNNEIGGGYVPCSIGEHNYNLTFTFTNFDIAVSLSSLVQSLGDGSSNCSFLIMPSGRGGAILGDSFLSSAYVVHDLSNNEVSLAPRNKNPGVDNIVEIGNSNIAPPAALTVSVNLTVSAAIPATVLLDTNPTSTGDPWGFNPTATSRRQLFTSTSTALAAFATSHPRGVIAGLAGAGMLLAL